MKLSARFQTTLQYAELRSRNTYLVQGISTFREHSWSNNWTKIKNFSYLNVQISIESEWIRSLIRIACTWLVQAERMWRWKPWLFFSYKNWWKWGKCEESCEKKSSYTSSTERFVYLSSWLFFRSIVELYTDKFKNTGKPKNVWRRVNSYILNVIFCTIMTHFYQNFTNFHYKRKHFNDRAPITVFNNKIIHLFILKAGVILVPT